MANYSTLFEAYNVETFEKKPKEKFGNKASKKNEKFMNDYSTQDDCYYTKYKLNSDFCNNKNNINTNNEFCDKFTDMKNPNNPNNPNNTNNSNNKCTSLQAPNYEYPVTDEAKKEYDNALKTSLNTTTANQISYDDFNKMSNINNIQPFYDDDLEQYLNINNFKDAINYKVKSNNNIENKNTEKDDNSKSINNNINNSNPNDNKINTNNNTNNNTSEYTNIKTDTTKLILSDTSKKPVENKKDIFYKNLINIGLYIFIGIVIILLCDQIAEIAINIGMKRTVQILEPYLQKINTQQQIVFEQPPPVISTSI